MDPGLISLSDVLDFMLQRNASGKYKSFSCIVCRYDARTDTSGVPIFYDKVRIKRNDRAHSASGSAGTTAAVLALKNPNHFKNATRNIILENGDIRKIHIRDISIFNGKKVHW